MSSVAMACWFTPNSP